MESENSQDEQLVGSESDEQIEQEGDQSEEEEEEEEIKSEKVLGDIKTISENAIAEYNERVRRSGVIYLSSIPPYMKAEKIKFLLGKVGKVMRMHLVEEDAAIARRRKLNGGSRKKKFTEGWIEFENKRDAKKCAAMLNGQIVGGKKSGFHHDILWSIKYLKNFKWSDLMEKLTLEKRLRADRLKAEFAKHRKLDEKYLENVTKAEKFEIIRKKRAEKKKESEEEEN